MTALAQVPDLVLGVSAFAALGYAIYKEFVSRRLQSAAELSLQQTIETITSDHARVAAERDDAHRTMQQMSKQLLNFRVHVAEIIVQNRQLQGQYQSLREEREQLMTKIGELTSKVDELRKQNDQLLKELRKLEDTKNA